MTIKRHAKSLSVLIAMHNEESNVSPLLKRITAAAAPLGVQLEILVINDGSTDQTALRLSEERKSEPRLKVIHLSRRFGHQPAISAALDHAAGDVCVLMDGDQQDPPELIPRLLEAWEEGFDVVHARRTDRAGETLFKRLTAWLFYRALRSMSEVPLWTDTGEYRLMDRRVVETLRQFAERGRFLRGLVSWVGFRQTAIPYSREARSSGQTKYSSPRMIRLALDAMTAFTVAPLQLATLTGALFSLGSFVYAGFVLYAHGVLNRTITGWTSLMMVVLFFGGVQLMFLGLLGEYIGRILEETKKRPLYIVESREGF